MSQRNRSQRRNITQPPPTQLDNLDDYVNRCVRYIIYRSGSNEPIKKNELKKNVLTNVGKHYDRILQKSADVLDRVYGFNLVICQENNNTLYITKRNVEYGSELYEDEGEIPADIHKVLIMLVLTNIYMSQNPVSEASMLIFLNSLGVDCITGKGIFGKVKEFINNGMVKENYIVAYTDPLSNEITYTWGPRAEQTISKHDILKFVSKIYKDKQPTSWVAQYEEANNQFQNDAEAADPNETPDN